MSKKKVNIKCFLAKQIGFAFKTYEDDKSGCEHLHALPSWYNDILPWGSEVNCHKCGKQFAPTIKGHHWDTKSGNLEPGAMFWDYNYEENLYWDNHKGPHLCVVLPDMHIWNIDSRASNCTDKNNRLHRCWVRHGEPPNITVDKHPANHTCKAGGGSILTHGSDGKESFHGFLRNGHIVK